ncbi:hypothetical protein CFN78_20835 [Amycolatopsis antarctica]|uniref:Uncharacterized protein n=1 Tax=Amycolatopsis antarctica TaxID=1854586 RepID=A0A263CZD2_9PSEU|nr:hypothetical protein [Amycolatopsis antarctica]OZM71248.1 hypothetical protein CFN78_20835 [Amycolatopsis antarctica]
MGKGGWAFLRGLGLVVMAGCGQAIFRGFFDRDAQLLWGAFDWAPGGREGRLAVIGAIALGGLLIAVVAGFGGRRSSRDGNQAVST